MSAVDLLEEAYRLGWNAAKSSPADIYESQVEWERDEALASLRAPSPAQGWKNFLAERPEDFARIMVAGWQTRGGPMQGYWWIYEDQADEDGRPTNHPHATLWVSLAAILPPIPPIIPIAGYYDPPPAPAGMTLEVQRDEVTGIVTGYRHVMVPAGAASTDGGE